MEIKFDTANDLIVVTLPDGTVRTYVRADAGQYLMEMGRPADLEAMGWTV